MGSAHAWNLDEMFTKILLAPKRTRSTQAKHHTPDQYVPDHEAFTVVLVTLARWRSPAKTLKKDHPYMTHCIVEPSSTMVRRLELKLKLLPYLDLALKEVFTEARATVHGSISLQETTWSSAARQKALNDEGRLFDSVPKAPLKTAEAADLLPLEAKVCFLNESVGGASRDYVCCRSGSRQQQQLPLSSAPPQSYHPRVRFVTGTATQRDLDKSAALYIQVVTVNRIFFDFQLRFFWAHVLISRNYFNIA